MVMVIISLFNNGLYYLYTDMPVFKAVHDYFKPDETSPQWKFELYKPFFGCPICFSSVYGSIIFFIVAPYFDVFELELYPIILIGSVFTSQLLLYLKEKIE